MGKAIDLLYEAFVKIEADGSLILDHDFMMKIFSPLYEQLPEFKKDFDYLLEEKQGNNIGSKKSSDSVLSIDEALYDLLYPVKLENVQTTEFCAQLGVGSASMMLTKLTDPTKLTYHRVSKANWKYSQMKITDKYVTETLGNRANNDPSEVNFATFTDILYNGGRISLESAAGIGQSRYNKYMARDHAKFMTGRKSQVDLLTPELGTFHKLQEKLQNSLLAFLKQRTSQTRSNFNEQLHLQQSKRAEMKKSANDLKEKNSEETHVLALYFHQEYHSPRCARTVQQALNAYEKLTTTKR